MPRIISGTAKGTHLLTPKGHETRPTADRVKEALFSILQTGWPPDGFLDLYSGTGQIGLEAASRGAGRVVLVESNKACCRVIIENAKKTRLMDQIQLIPRPVDQALLALRAKGETFDFIFADPPYQKAESELIRLSDLISNLLSENGLFILEQEARQPVMTNVMHLQPVRCCQYGTAMLSFYRKAVSSCEP